MKKYITREEKFKKLGQYTRNVHIGAIALGVGSTTLILSGIDYYSDKSLDQPYLPAIVMISTAIAAYFHSKRDKLRDNLVNELRNNNQLEAEGDLEKQLQ